MVWFEQFSSAKDRVANLAEHKGACAMFERLSFGMQDFLPDWVQDQVGHNHDLLLRAYDYDLRTPERKLATFL
jgi:hypothetical protein